MKDSIRLGIIIAIYSLISICIVLMFFAKMKETSKNNEMHTYSLGQLDQPGYVGVELYYDKEPVNIRLISPKEKTIYSEFAQVYSIDKDNKIMTFLFDSSDVGLWKLEFNNKSNDKISYKFIQGPSPIIHVSDLMVYEDGNDTYICFTPFCEEKEELATDTDAIRYNKNLSEEEILNKCQYSMLAYSDDFSLPLDDAIIDLNKPVMLKLELPDNMYNGKTYRIRVCCMMLDDINNSDFKEIKIQTENITTTETTEATEEGEQE